VLKIHGLDHQVGRRFEKEKVAKLPFQQDPSGLQCNSLLVNQAVLDKGKIVNMDVTNPKSDLPVLHYSQPDQDQDIIKTLALEAAKYGVPALIVTRDPGMPHNIPVFVFDEDEMRDLMNFYTVFISISIKGKSLVYAYGDDDATFSRSRLKGILQEWSEGSLESYGSAMRLLQLAKDSGSNPDAENGEI